jgi:hypothetical protein
MHSMSMPSRSHQTESLERLGLAKGTPLSERIAPGRPRSRKSCSKAVMAGSSLVPFRASHRSKKREAWRRADQGVWCADFKAEFRLGDGRYCYPSTVTD